MISKHPIPGLLRDSELDEIVASYTKQRLLVEIDEQARDMLARRGAATGWEAAAREKGFTRFVLGEHRMAGEIAAGETYNVMLGQHLFLGRVDVLKVVRAHKIGPAVVAAHLRRLHAQASLNCAQVVRVYDVGCEGALHFAVVEHVMGTNLRNLVRKRGPLPMNLAATIFAQAAIALDAMHSHGYMHCGLRPSKILVAEGADGVTKLCDAGSGEAFGVVNGPLMNTGGRVLDFLAPEVIAGEAATTASDVYSLGCLLYYAVTSKVPFPGGTEDWKREAHRRLYPMHPKNLAEGLDDSFIEVIAAMMAKEPSKRLEGMRDVVAGLHKWVR